MDAADLLLEKPTVDDVAAVHRIYGDRRLWTHLPSGRHVDLRTTQAMVSGWIEGWERDGLSTWLVRDAASGELLGTGGCSLREGVFWNLGYRVAVAAQGRGATTRVARLAVERAAATRPELPVVAYLLEHNRASARVAEKVGLVLRHRAPDAGNPDPEAVRLVYADRALTEPQLRAALA
jgi:RimJ/RimL family protein N-acetyltransferase